MQIVNVKFLGLCMILPIVAFALNDTQIAGADATYDADEFEDLNDVDELNGDLIPTNGTLGEDDLAYPDESIEDDRSMDENEEDDGDGDELDRMATAKNPTLQRRLRPEGARCRRRLFRTCQLGLYCKLYRICTTRRPCPTGINCRRRCRRRGVCTRSNPSSTTSAPNVKTTTTQRPRTTRTRRPRATRTRRPWTIHTRRPRTTTTKKPTTTTTNNPATTTKKPRTTRKSFFN